MPSSPPARVSLSLRSGLGIFVPSDLFFVKSCISCDTAGCRIFFHVVMAPFFFDSIVASVRKAARAVQRCSSPLLPRPRVFSIRVGISYLGAYFLFLRRTLRPKTTERMISPLPFISLFLRLRLVFALLRTPQRVLIFFEVFSAAGSRRLPPAE